MQYILCHLYTPWADFWPRIKLWMWGRMTLDYRKFLLAVVGGLGCSRFRCTLPEAFLIFTSRSRKEGFELHYNIFGRNGYVVKLQISLLFLAYRTE